MSEYLDLDLQDDYHSHIPLLKDLLEAVCNDETFKARGVKFNLELKGYKKELGPRALEIIEKGHFQDCVGMFSTFEWKAPKCTKQVGSRNDCD